MFTYQRKSNGSYNIFDKHDPDVFYGVTWRDGTTTWGGTTWSTQTVGNPELSLSGMSTRDDVGRALKAVRHAWSQVGTPVA